MGFFHNPANQREFYLPLVASFVLHILLLGAIAFFPFFKGKRFYKVPVTYSVSLVELPESRAVTVSPPALPPPTPKTLKAKKEVSPPRAKVKKPATPRPSEEMAIPKGKAKPPEVVKEKKVEAPEPPVVQEQPSQPQVQRPGEKVASIPATPEVAPVPSIVPERGLTIGPGATGTARVEGDFEFTYYLAIIENKIGGNWVAPRLKLRPEEAARATVSFRVHRSGQVRNIELEAPSGIAFFDQSALRAVYRSIPLPPLPPRFKEESLFVHFSFELRGEEG